MFKMLNSILRPCALVAIHIFFLLLSTQVLQAQCSASISGDLVICPEGNRVLTASGGSTYLWSTGATTAAITVTTANTFTVTATDATGCTATAIATTRFLSTGNISASPNNTNSNGYWVCLGSTITLSSTAPGGVWGAVPETSGPEIVSIHPTTGVVTGLYSTPFNVDSQTVYYRVSAPGCTLATFRSIEVRGLNPGTIMGDPPPCNNANGTYSMQLASNGASGGTWASSNPTFPITSSGFLTYSGEGTTTITYTVSDFWCTNSTTKQLTFNTYANANINLPAQVCEASVIPLSVADAGPGATYNWSGNGIVNVNSNSTTASPSGTGFQSYTATVTTAAGCTSQGFGLVQVNPFPNTTITATPNPICVGESVNLSVPVAASTTYAWAGPGINSSTGSSITATPTSAGVNTYTVTATTGTCTSTGTADVTVNEASFNCPADRNVTLDANCNMVIPNLIAGLTSNPGCTPLTFTQSPAAGTTVPSAHDGTVAVVITPGNPNVAPCTVILTAKDLTAPAVVCKNHTAYLDAAGTASVTTANVFQSGTDNCGTVNLVSALPNAFTCSNIGANTVTLTVNDGNGNASTCSATVTVSDTIKPTVVCKNTTITLSVFAIAFLSPLAVFDSGTDNCGGVNPFSVSATSFDCSNVGPNTVTLTASDGSGNTATCQAIVTVRDPIPPTVYCFNPTISVNAAGVVTLLPSQVFLYGSDTWDCGVVNPQSVSPNTFNCSTLGVRTVVLTANDSHGNTATCSATVTVVDAVAPTVVCKQNTVALLNASGTATITPASVYQSGGDNCGTVNLVSVSPNTVNCNDALLVQKTVVLTVNDGHGNTSTCSATVLVYDIMPPTVVCKNYTANLNASGTVSINYLNVLQSYSDNCSQTIYQPGVTPSTFNCAKLGANTVTLSVKDRSNNPATCTAVVTVVDAIAPTVVCKNHSVNLDATGAASITTADVFQSGADNCGTVNQVSVMPNVLNCNNLGANTVTLTVNDGHGNTSTCSATVTVADATAPTVVCKNYTANLDAAGNASIATADVFQSGGDNCGTVNQVSVTPNTFSCGNLGANTVTLTVNDGHGNTSTCSAIVTVVDAIAPTVVCKNYTTEINGSGTANVSMMNVFAGGSDNCGTVNLVSVSPNTFTCSNLGANTVTLTVNDGHGNTATCLATVTVGQYAFSVSLPACQTVYFGYAPAACATINSTVSGGSAPYSYSWSNNATTSGIQYCATSENSPSPFSLTVTDANGCSASANASVINVVDIRCGNNLDKVLICHSGNTLCLGQSALIDHLAHGDQLGGCTAPNPCNPSEFAPNNNGINAPGSMKSLHEDDIDMLLYPNPTSGWVNIHLHGFEDQESQLMVFDGLEKLVLSKTVTDHTEQVQIDLSQQPSGTYYVRLVSSKGSVVKQLLITK